MCKVCLTKYEFTKLISRIPDDLQSAIACVDGHGVRSDCAGYHHRRKGSTLSHGYREILCRHQDWRRSTECLREHHGELSPACRARGKAFLESVHEVCHEDVAKYCKGTGRIRLQRAGGSRVELTHDLGLVRDQRVQLQVLMGQCDDCRHALMQ